MYAKELYPALFAKVEPDPVKFLDSIIASNNHNIWFACRDFAKQILKNNVKWDWLSYRVDDFGGEVEKLMRKKLPKWTFKAKLGVGALAKHLHSTESVAKWLMDRYVAELKNIFDKRGKDPLCAIHVVSLEEFKEVTAYYIV